ncbi:MAG: insulinase family protein [Muribaculaceae bacterium]|nr:insulinase family protein [Muribaculaceae bacterium]
MNYTLFALDNGLRVVHHADSTSAMVALNVLYNVGARDEDPELTGLAHLFEHLMFGGSVNIADFDGELELAGGSNNAWTSDDFTNFWQLLPAVNAESAFRLESDRMLGLAFSPRSLEVQRGVVLEEFKQVCLNRPYGDMAHELRDMLYTVHPYRYPTIGKEPAHIERVTMDHVRRFFYSHYAPNNAVLAVTGNISLDRTRSLAEKWFGPIPRRHIAPRLYPQEPLHLHPVRRTIERHVPQACIVKAFPMDGYGTHRYICADLITDILSSGHSSRFYRELIMGTDIFSEADASISGNEEPGYLMVTGRLRENTPEALRRAEDAIDAQLHRIATQPVSDHELLRAQNRFESNYTFNQLTALSQAQTLSMAVMHSEDPDQTVSRYRAVTPAQILSTAATILSPTRSCTLIITPTSA